MLKIHSGSGADNSTEIYWGSQIQIWPNTRGAACLYDAQGRLSAEFQYAFDVLPPSGERPQPGQISLTRPVSGSVPNELGYGCQKEEARFKGFHNGYDYGFDSCDPIREPVLAAGEGTVLSTWEDVPLPLQPGQLNGGLRIDHGVHALADGRVVHLISEYDHVLPLVQPDVQVKPGDRVADFSTCERFGYSPKLHFQVIALDPRLTIELSSQDLHSYLVDLIDAGEQLTIDPAMAGLLPD
jgi:hypothetical protein